MSDVRLYSRALSADEIRQLSQASAPDPSLKSPEHRLGLRPHFFFRSGVVTAEAYLRRTGTPWAVALEAALVKAGSDRPLLNKTVSDPKGIKDAELTFAPEKLEPGDYEIRVQAKDKSGRSLAHASASVRVPQKPLWLDTKAGMTDRVLAPWTPLKVREEATHPAIVECWGRSYHWLPGPFPGHIVSAGHEVLAEPIRLVGRVDGREILWTMAPAVLKEETPAKVTLLQAATDPSLKLSVTTQVEYDGMIRLDCALEPTRPATLEKLDLEIPLRREHASLVYYYRDTVFKGPGALPAAGVVRSFNPAIWIGDEECGLQWFTESDRDWIPADSKQAIEIATSAEQAVLRLHLVAQPVALRPGVPRTVESLPGLSYTFGLEATPLKPVTRDAWDYRIISSPWYSEPYGLLTKEVDGKPGLDYIAEKGVRTHFISSAWTDIHGAPECVGHADELHRIVGGCHKRGIQVTVYLGNILTDFAPEYPAFLDDFVNWDRSAPYSIYSYACNTPPGKTYEAYVPCVGSDWRNLVLDGAARLMDEFDIDGFYLDGLGLAGPCYNRHHGCGYLRPDGSVGSTYPFFAGRDVIRRLYQIVKSRKPDGQVDLHAATYWITSTMAWVTTVWDGESILGDRLTPPERKGVHLLEYLPLDRFRGQFKGHAWGVPTEFLDYYIPYPFDRQYAMTLLHDLPIRAHANKEGIDFNAKLWKLFDEFDRKGAEWLPYWKNARYVKAEPEGVFVSLYRHPKNGVLAIVSNLGKEKTHARIQ
ncbi:MAG: glycoside hydrolase domain-containing protein, partial [Alphaproteobacteria bacterium]